MLVAPSDEMGRGERRGYGQLLMRSCFHTLGDVQPPPQAVSFLGGGVRLVVGGQPPSRISPPWSAGE